MRPGGENYSATFGEKYPAVDTPAEGRHMKLHIRTEVAPFTITRLATSFYVLLTEHNVPILF